MYRPHPHQTPYWNQRDLAPRYPGKVGREQWPYSAYAGEFMPSRTTNTALFLSQIPRHTLERAASGIRKSRLSSSDALSLRARPSRLGRGARRL
jgi:hypothetical protein